MLSLGRRRCLGGLCSGAGLLATNVVIAATEFFAASEDLLRLRFAISVTNPGDDALRPQSVWFYMPASETPTQRLEKLTATTEHEVVSDSLQHTILRLQVPAMPPFSTRQVGVLAETAVWRAPRQSVLSDHGKWLRGERYVDVSHPRILHLAASLTKRTDEETGRAIYDWLRTNLTYAGFIADDLGALYALDKRTGDCTEYAYLAVALARANGIPARMIGGFVVDRDAAPRADEYHNWAEIYLDGAWRLLDAQKECWLISSDRYISFRIYCEETINPLGPAHRFRAEGAVVVQM